jgi:hypothetical protein
MDRQELRATLRNTAECIKNGQATGLVDGVEGLLLQADQMIEVMTKELIEENKRGNRYADLHKTYKEDCEKAKAALLEMEADKEIFRRVVEHFLDND